MVQLFPNKLIEGHLSYVVSFCIFQFLYYCAHNHTCMDHVIFTAIACDNQLEVDGVQCGFGSELVWQNG